MKIRIDTDGTILRVYSPYNPAFVRRAHRLGGKWNRDKSSWDFDARDIERVRKMCLEVYGVDDSVPEVLYTLQAKAVENIEVSLQSIYFAGHQIARAWDRDSGAILGDGVILLEGEISSGGSRNYWKTILQKDSVIEIKDASALQVEIAKKAIERYGKWELIKVRKQRKRTVTNKLKEEEAFYSERLKEIKERRKSA
jgi:hypothetical protein